MATADSVKAKMQGLIDSANAKTGASDATLTAAVNTLIAGFGSGESEDTDLLMSILTRSITVFSDERNMIIGKSALKGCNLLKTISLPNVTEAYDEAFSDCQLLTSVNLPLLEKGERSVFSKCNRLVEICLPSLVSTKSETASGTGFFYRCTALRKVDFPKITSIGNKTFYECKSLTQVILRSETVCTLTTTGAFTLCYHFLGTVDATFNPDGLTDGYIYVPSALIEEYKVATNWSTFANQFRALEDYTIDGTTTGELDESKI